MYTRIPLSQYVEADHDGPFRYSEDAMTDVKQSDKLSPEEFITLRIWLYATPVLLLTGTLGSLASISILLRPNIRKSTPMYFLTLLSFTDVVVLWLGLLRLYISYVHGYDVRNFSNLSCKLHTFSVYFTLDMGSWLVALIAIERFLVVVCPHTVKLQWNRTKGTYAVIIVVIVLLLVNGHYLFTTYLQLPQQLPSNDTWETNTSINKENELMITTTTRSINLTEITYNVFSEEGFTDEVGLWLNVSEIITAGYNEINDSFAGFGSTDNMARCANQPWSEDFHNNIFPWIDFVAFFFLPFCVMVITHAGIIRHVHLVNVRLRKAPNAGGKERGRKEVRSPATATIRCLSTEWRTKVADGVTDIDGDHSTLDVSKGRKERQSGKIKIRRSKVPGVSLMLVSVLISFAITTSPITIYVITSLIESDPRKLTPSELARQNLQWVIVNMIQYANNASHFFLFILTSRNFRQEVLRMLTDCRLCFTKLGTAYRKWSNTVKPIPTR